MEEKGVPYQYNEVNPYKKVPGRRSTLALSAIPDHRCSQEPHFLKVNPKGLVPALEHHGKALYESLVLLEYLEDAYPSAPALRPRDAHEAGIVRLALQHISNVVVPTFYRYVQAQEPEKQAEGKQAFVKALQDTYEQWFVKGDAQWARGDDFGWIEAALVPWVARFPLLEKHRAFDIDDVGPEFRAWAQRALDRPSVKATTSEATAYEQIYRARPSSSGCSIAFAHLSTRAQAATSRTRPRARWPRRRARANG